MFDEIKDLVLLGCNGPLRGQAFHIRRLPCTIGRSSANDFPLPGDPCASGKHCRIVADGGRLLLEDLGSKNGTYHNGVRIAARQELVPGKSVLCIGRARFMLSASSQAGEAQVMSATQSIMIQGSVIIPGAVLRNRSAQEALLVMDVCDSTSLARRCGEDAVCRSVGLLTQMIETGPSGPTILFLKCTGDGFFATFPDVGAALGAAQDLLGWLRRHGADIGVPDLAIRIGVHYGEVQTDQSGDRLGLAANLVFRLQAAAGQERIKPPAGPAELPARNRILLTDVAVDRLSAAERAKARSAGHFLFKGFDFPVEVYLWS